MLIVCSVRFITHLLPEYLNIDLSNHIFQDRTLILFFLMKYTFNKLILSKPRQTSLFYVFLTENRQKRVPAKIVTLILTSKIIRYAVYMTKYNNYLCQKA